MDQFTITIAFILFLVPMGVLLENTYQLRKFETTLQASVDIQLNIVRDMQIAQNNTQSILINSVLARKVEQREILDRVDSVFGYVKRRDDIETSERLFLYMSPEGRNNKLPSPIKP